MIKMRFRNGFSKLPADVGVIGFMMTQSLDTKSSLQGIIALNVMLNSKVVLHTSP